MDILKKGNTAGIGFTTLSLLLIKDERSIVE